MKKITTDFLRTAGLSLAAATVALCGMTACSSDDNFTADEPATGQPAAVKTYRVSIPATFGSDATTRAVDFGTDGSTSTSTFKTTDNIYVYDVTQDLWALNSSNAYVPLKPEADAKTTQLTGTLTFYNPVNQEPAVGDVLRLFCNIGLEGTLSSFDYTGQTGSAATASACDFAEATMKIKAISGNATDGYTLELCQEDDERKTTATFENLQSMFRQRLSFTDANGQTVTPTITSLFVASKNKNRVAVYFPLNATQNTFNRMTIDNPVIDANGDIYFAMRFVGSDGTDALTFTAQDDDENVYELTKAAPTGGFQNGRYYHGAMTLPYARKANQPVVTGTSTTPNSYNTYRITDDPTNITISGTSVGYKFRLTKDATVTLNGLTASVVGNYVIYAEKNLNIVVNGTNSISCTGYPQPISAPESGKTIKLSGSGTLTVTGTNSNRCGLYAEGNYTESNNSDASVLAADGYTVTRSDMTSNGDGTYTWTYTVAPNPLETTDPTPDPSP